MIDAIEIFGCVLALFVCCFLFTVILAWAFHFAAWLMKVKLRWMFPR